MFRIWFPALGFGFPRLPKKLPAGPESYFYFQFIKSNIKTYKRTQSLKSYRRRLIECNTDLLETNSDSNFYFVLFGTRPQRAISLYYCMYVIPTVQSMMLYNLCNPEEM